ncbi:Uncharacterised protein [Klebsiella pneumoniae]|nr:Uncharacterised protein [Klebsiella pneumoniae]
MHQQEVLPVRFQTHLVRHPRRHRHRRHPRRADQRVDFVPAEHVHQLRHQHPGGGPHAEGDHPQHQDPQRLRLQELVRHQLGPHRQPEEDGDDVDQRVLHRIAQPLHHAALAHQVAEAEHPQQRRGVRQQERHQQQQHRREEDLLPLTHRAQLHHADLPLLIRGQRLHDRRLDQRHQRHIGVRRHRDGPQQLRRQLARQVNRRRAVGAADDADGRRLRQGEADDAEVVQRQRPEHGGEDPELRRRPQQQGARVSQQRAEIGHRPDAHKDDQRRDARANRHLIEDGQHPGGVAHVHREALHLPLYRRQGQRQCLFDGVDVRRAVELRGNHRQLRRVVVSQQALQGGERQPGLRDIGEQAAEANRQQQ